MFVECIKFVWFLAAKNIALAGVKVSEWYSICINELTGTCLQNGGDSYILRGFDSSIFPCF